MENATEVTEPASVDASNTLMLLRLHKTELSLFRSVRNYGRTCAHIGCSLPSGRSSEYCCADHKTYAAAAATIQVAFEYRDSFVNEVDRERICCTVLYNRCRGLQVGIPTLEKRIVGDVFSKTPWEQSHVFPTNVGTKDLLFFMEPPSQYKSMTIGTIKLKWHSMVRFGLQLEGGEDQDTVFMTQFFLDLEKPFRDGNKELYRRCKMWYLFLFQSGEHSLYCLTCSRTGGVVEPTVIREQKNKKVPPPPSTSTPPAQGPHNQSQNSSAGKEKGKGRDLGKGNTSSAKPPMIGYFGEWVNGTKFQISTSKYVFFPEVCGSIFDSHHGFHVEYGTDRGVDLGFHLDDSELRSNVSLSKQFEENFTRIGELFFRGTRCKKHDVTHTDTKPEEISDDSHTPDQAVLRLGSRATTSGHGASMIPCSVLKREEIISQGILKLVRSMLQRKESEAEPDSCCQKKGVY